MQHRLAFPLVKYTGRYTIRFESDIDAGGSGLPKRPHVHVYEGRKISPATFVASFWIEPSIEEKARRAGKSDAEVGAARRAVEQYQATAMSKWCHHFEPYFRSRPKPKIISFDCTDPPRVAVLCPGRYLVVYYCNQAIVLWFENVPEFQTATQQELRNVTAPDPTSPWLHWPDLDADIFLEELV